MDYNFLFWNLYGNQTRNQANRNRNLCEAIANLALTHRVDVFVFCECSIPDDVIVGSLNATGKGPYYGSDNKSNRIKYFSKFDSSVSRSVYTDRVSDRLAVQEFQIGNSPGILLAGMHFFYRGDRATDAGRFDSMIPFAADLAGVEKDSGHDRTILVGDFNMNAYEGAMNATSGLHAVISRELAVALPRTKARKDRKIFFNPTWSNFGDFKNRIAGSYYYASGDTGLHLWNLYDQVLLRPSLMNNLADLSILNHDGKQPLVTRSGIPRKHSLSDHLPIHFTMSL